MGRTEGCGSPSWVFISVVSEHCTSRLLSSIPTVWSWAWRAGEAQISGLRFFLGGDPTFPAIVTMPVV
jgi:hypothetical protein